MSCVGVAGYFVIMQSACTFKFIFVDLVILIVFVFGYVYVEGVGL